MFDLKNEHYTEQGKYLTTRVHAIINAVIGIFGEDN